MDAIVTRDGQPSTDPNDILQHCSDQRANQWHCDPHNDNDDVTNALLHTITTAQAAPAPTRGIIMEPPAGKNEAITP